MRSPLIRSLVFARPRQSAPSEQTVSPRAGNPNGHRPASGASRELRVELEAAQHLAQFATHVTSAARDLPDHFALGLNVVPRVVEEESRRSPRPLGEEHPRVPDLAGVARRHDVAVPAEAQAPARRLGGPHHSLEIAATG